MGVERRVTLRFNLPRFLLVEAKRMLARNELLLPSFNLFSLGKGQGIHDAFDDSRESTHGVIYAILTARITHNLCSGIITVFICLGRNCQLGNLLRWFVALSLLVSPAEDYGNRYTEEMTDPPIPESSSEFS